MNSPKLLYITGIILGFYSLIFDSFYDLTTTLCIFYPIIQILIFKFKFKINNPLTLDEENLKNLNLGLILPVIALITRFWYDCNIFINSNYWLYNILLLTIIIFTTSSKSKIINSLKTENIRKTITILLFLILYTSTSIGLINSTFDFSQPINEDVIITNKEKFYTKNSGHQFNISFTFGKNTKSKTIAVSEYYFTKCETGKVTKIKIRKGLLNIPWIHK